MTQNVWVAGKAFLRENFIAIQSNLKEQESSQINNITPKAIRERRITTHQR